MTEAANLFEGHLPGRENTQIGFNLTVIEMPSIWPKGLGRLSQNFFSLSIVFAEE